MLLEIKQKQLWSYNQILEDFIKTDFQQVQLLPAVFNFIMCMIMSFVIRDLYVKRSFSLTGKLHVGTVIPLLSAIVFLVIVFVKSSLALSLGLVGALSIVRFRTPIKEPEELVYLFFAIAIGLGYAAGQTAITTILALFILAIVYFFPTLHVEYQREYFTACRNIRVTIDEHIRFKSPLQYRRASQKRHIPYAPKIVEIKFPLEAKDVVSELIRFQTHIPKRHSKYLVGMSLLGQSSYI